MADSCCDTKNVEILHRSQSKTLWIVLLINGLMFFVEFFSGIYAQSLALVGDSLDMLGDFLSYSVSLYVIHKGLGAKLKASRFKAALIVLAGVGVFAQAIYRMLNQELPDATIMGGVGSLALIMNLICLYLLTKHRNDDLNFKSVWLCSRNDIIANVSVLIAAGAVMLFNSHWPDVIVGLAILIFFVRSASFIFSEAKRQSSDIGRSGVS